MSRSATGLCYLGGSGKYARVVDPLPYSLGSQYSPEMLKKYPLYFIVKRLPSATKEVKAIKDEELKIPHRLGQEERGVLIHI